MRLCQKPVKAIFLLLLMALSIFLLLTVPLEDTQSVANQSECPLIPRDASSHSIKQNPDGSMEVYFKIRQISKSSLNKSHLLRSIKLSPFTNNKTVDKTTIVLVQNEKNTPTATSNITSAVPKKTLYPLTLDSPYILNNRDLCKNVEKPVLIIVHTAPAHTSRRRAIRETWANSKIIDKGRIRIAFLFGTTKDRQTQLMLENESLLHGDVVQGRFLDSYHNLTHKGVLGYRWISEFCSDIRFLIKVDDDMFVNILKVIDEYIPKYVNKTRFMACHVRRKGTSPIVRVKSKWQVSSDEFRNMTHYPVTYCNGFFVMMSPGMVRELYRAAYTTPFFWVDDVYLYGLLPYKIGNVEHINLGPNLTLVQNDGIKCFTGNKTCPLVGANVVSDGIMEKVWYSCIEMFRNLAAKYLPKEILTY